MKFTAYYSNLLKTSGVPNSLGVKQYQYIFNVLVLEMRIDEVNKLSRVISVGDANTVLNKRCFDLLVKLDKLTKGKSPEEIMRALIDSME